MFKRTKQGYVCLRCLSRRSIATTADAASQIRISALPPPPPPSGAAQLTNKRLIAIHGQDATHFLQGIITNNIRSGQTAGLYSAFLTAQGRVLFDVFIYPSSHTSTYRQSLPAHLSPDDPAYLIEVDAREAERLFKHIKRYKLRAKFDLRLVEPDEWHVWSVWREQDKWTPHPHPSPTSMEHHGVEAPDTDGVPGCVDARAPGMGRRIVLPSSIISPLTRPSLLSSLFGSAPVSEPDLQETTLGAYTVRRMLRGVPEGQSEIFRATALPQESNMDFMSGIDFRKGCYVGQELTIRTHHTGVVRKRMLPVMLYPFRSTVQQGVDAVRAPEKLEYDPASDLPQPPRNADITRAEKKGRRAGKWISGIGNVGLALCRLEIMTDLVLTSEGSQWHGTDEFKIAWSDSAEVDANGEVVAMATDGGEVGVKAFVPDWMRNRLKFKSPNRRVE